jgi:hypothetical protein
MLLNEIQKSKVKELYNIYKNDTKDLGKLSHIFGSKVTENRLLKSIGYIPEKGLEARVWKRIASYPVIVYQYSLGELILMESRCPSYSYRNELCIDTDSLANVLCPKLAKYHDKDYKFYQSKAKKFMDNLCPYETLKRIS